MNFKSKFRTGRNQLGYHEYDAGNCLSLEMTFDRFQLEFGKLRKFVNLHDLYFILCIKDLFDADRERVIETKGYFSNNIYLVTKVNLSFPFPLKPYKCPILQLKLCTKMKVPVFFF